MPIKLKENKMHGMSWSYKMQDLKMNAYADFLDHVLLQHGMPRDMAHFLEEAIETTMDQTQKWD